MRVAFTVWEGRVAPVFDVSREAWVLSIQDGAVVSRSTENIAAPTGARKAERLAELGVGTLVCGAISEPMQHELTIRSVEVIGFVAGDIETVVDSFLSGGLPTRELTMPGCGGAVRRASSSRHAGYVGDAGAAKAAPLDGPARDESRKPDSGSSRDSGQQ